MVFSVFSPESVRRAAGRSALGLLAVLLACALAPACGLDTGPHPAGGFKPIDAAADGGDASADVAQSCLPTPDQKQCGDKCVDKTDPDFGCDNQTCAPCALANATAVCKAGACAVASCDPGHLDCDGDPSDGCEIKSDSDPAHCGDCGTDCTTLDASKQWQCVSGQCQLLCPPGKGDCNHDATDGCETDLTTSAANCGACGRACSTANGYTPVCSNGLCSLTCYSGWGDCSHPAVPTPDDGCETDVHTSAANCGGCNEPCSLNHSLSATCNSGYCEHTCQAGWADCKSYQTGASDDGCQTNVAVDPDNCGACNRRCSTTLVATRSCQGGLCNSTCQPDWGNCSEPAAPATDNGCETYLETPQNCGGCARSCSNAHAYSSGCSGGLCVPNCEPNWADCISPAAPALDDGCECNGHCAGGKCQ